MDKAFDVIIMTTAADYIRIKGNVNRIVDLVPGLRFYFVGSDQVEELVRQDCISDRVGFINENSIIPFNDVHNVVKATLHKDDVPRGITGWYYQQFLKMKYALVSEHDFYMSWDGDTVPCKAFEMFDSASNKPYFDVKSEYHEEYFTTISTLFPGMNKVIGKSFISEHMLFNKDIMKELISEIESNKSIEGKTFYEKIIHAIRPGQLVSNSFSEFETYGTYVAVKHNEAYRLRAWHSIRYGSMYFTPQNMTEADYEWVGKDFDAISFEKNQEYIPELAKYFNTPEYREKLSAKYILETIQDCSSEGMKEVWE